MTGQGIKPNDPGPSTRNTRSTRLRGEDASLTAVTRTQRLKERDSDLSARIERNGLGNITQKTVNLIMDYLNQSRGLKTLSVIGLVPKKTPQKPLCF